LKNLNEIKKIFTILTVRLSIMLGLLTIISFGFGVLCGVLAYDAPTGWHVVTLIPLAILIMFIDVITSQYVWILLLTAFIVKVVINAKYKCESKYKKM